MSPRKKQSAALYSVILVAACLSIVILRLVHAVWDWVNISKSNSAFPHLAVSERRYSVIKNRSNKTTPLQ